jgi:hypothetical protein
MLVSNLLYVLCLTYFLQYMLQKLHYIIIQKMLSYVNFFRYKCIIDGPFIPNPITF